MTIILCDDYSPTNHYRVDFCFFSYCHSGTRIIIVLAFVFSPLPWWKGETLSSRFLFSSLLPCWKDELLSSRGFCFFSHCRDGKTNCYRAEAFVFSHCRDGKAKYYWGDFCFFPHCHSVKANHYRVNFCFFPMPWCGNVNQLLYFFIQCTKLKTRPMSVH